MDSNAVHPDYAMPDVPYDKSSGTDTRTRYEHDLSAIIYCNAFKRMSNKSQIIVRPLRDHFRSRMVHSHEVADIATALGRLLGLNVGLVRAIALGHDLGHTPFGHAGEAALSTLVGRVLTSSFKVVPPDSSKLFSHASNSARILCREGDISRECIEGVLAHSWNPWKGTLAAYKEGKRYEVKQGPSTYEAQVVAIADQLASINHDIEDIVSGALYTNYPADVLRSAVIRKLGNTKLENVKPEEVLNLFVTTEPEKAFGRKYRIEHTIQQVADHSSVVLHDGPKKVADAPTKPIGISRDWALLLDAIESTIRDVVHSEPWFVGRDAMAAAMISVAFNHLWPCVKGHRGGRLEVPGQGELFRHGEREKAGMDEPRKYLEHFTAFYNEHYVETEIQTDYLECAGSEVIQTWDRRLFPYARQALAAKAFANLNLAQIAIVNLVAVADFVAGFTDRYCVQMFADLHSGFLTQG